MENQKSKESVEKEGERQERKKEKKRLSNDLLLSSYVSPGIHMGHYRH